MKLRSLLALFLLVFSLSTQAAVSDPLTSVPTKEQVSKMTEEEKTARIDAIRLRVEEIKGMEKSALTRTEKKELKKELRELKKAAEAVRGVYLSIGAIIIIILLLILIL